MFFRFDGDDAKPAVALNVVLQYCFAPPDPQLDQGRATAPRDFLADLLFSRKRFSIEALGGFGIDAARQHDAAKRRSKAAAQADKADHPLRFKVPNLANRADVAPADSASLIKANKAAQKAEKKADKEQNDHNNRR